MFFLFNFKKKLLVKSSLKFLNFFTLKNLNNKKIFKLNNFYYQKTNVYCNCLKNANIKITTYQCIDREIDQKYLF